MTSLGAAFFGVVWGWLACPFAWPPAAPRTLIAVGVSTAAAVAAAFWIGGTRAVWFAGAGMLAGFVAHAGWRAGLRRMARQNN
jgi:hypothetical protein